MKVISLGLICVCLAPIVTLLSAQDAFPKLADHQIETIAELPDELIENSGNILTQRGTILGHNDSESGAVLYEYQFDGTLQNTIEVKKARNIDWEDITTDGDYIYVSDTGNNEGKRKKFTIYKFRRLSSGTSVTSVTAEKIKFKYPDQGKTAGRTDHNFDCEAIITLNGKLYVFTKNRGNKYTALYAIPSQPGKHVASRIAEFNTMGLITGADHLDGHLVLVGYNRVQDGFQSFLWHFWDFDGESFFSGKSARIDLPFLSQSEAVVFIDSDHVVVTNEEEEGGIGKMYKVRISDIKD